MSTKIIEEMTTEQCYDELDKLAERRRTEGRGRNPDAYHARYYCKIMKKEVEARLRELGAPLTRPDDHRVYGPGQAKWQQAGE